MERISIFRVASDMIVLSLILAKCAVVYVRINLKWDKIFPEDSGSMLHRHVSFQLHLVIIQKTIT
jgi:hypothetical protein